MSNESPYSHLFHLFGQQPEQTVECINAEAFQQLIFLLSRPVEAAGRCLLLRAPRAGYGKSHLLSRVQQQLGGSHVFILLQPADGYRVDAEAALTDVLAKLTRILPGSGGLTVLDLLARKVLAMGLMPLVRSGQVPCQDRESALAALHNRPVETFDFHHPKAVTAHWTRDNYELLGPRLVLEISQLLGSPMREVGLWVDVMFRYSVTPLDQPGRAGLLVAAVSNAAGVSMSERLSTLLKMLTHLQRVVLVADELEGMSANADAALRLATFVTTLRHGAGRVDTVISVNDDVWENVFLPRLSDGLKDRLSEVEIRLNPLTREQALQLLRSRDNAATAEQLGAFSADGGDLFARGVLRAAAAAWSAMPAATQSPDANPMPLSEPVGAFTGPPSLSGNPVREPVPSVELRFPVANEHEPAVGLTPEPCFATAAAFAETTSPACEEVAMFPWEKYDASPLAGEIGPPPPAPPVERPVFMAPSMMESVAANEACPPFQPVPEAFQPTVTDITAPVGQAFQQTEGGEQEQPVQLPWWVERSVSDENADIVPLKQDDSPFSKPVEPQAANVHGVDTRIAPNTVTDFDFYSVPQEFPPAPPVDRPIVAQREFTQDQTAAQAAHAETPCHPVATNTGSAEGSEWPVQNIPEQGGHALADETPASGEKVPNDTSVAPAVPEPSAAATRTFNNEIDRVDELLKQFRERYGRP